MDKVGVNTVYALIEEFKDSIKMKDIGFPENWKDVLEEQVIKDN